MTTTFTTYDYKGFLVVPCEEEAYPNGKWDVRDFRDYDEEIGSLSTNICVPTIRQAKEKINKLLAKEAA